MAPNLAEMLIRWSMTLKHFLLRNFKMAAKPILLPYWLKFQKSFRKEIRNCMCNGILLLGKNVLDMILL